MALVQWEQDKIDMFVERLERQIITQERYLEELKIKHELVKNCNHDNRVVNERSAECTTCGYRWYYK